MQASGAAQAEKEAQARAATQRQVAWLHKLKRPGGPTAWRPKNKMRKASCQLLQSPNHQMQAAVGVGILHFRQPVRLSERRPWPTWPLLSVACDLGSDNCCALQYLERHLSINLDLVPDPSHGTWDDAKLCLRRAGFWTTVQLVMLGHNVVHGPYNEDLRYEQVVRTITK